MARRRTQPAQQELPLPKPRGTWGGRRDGAGRPSKKGTSVPHVRRPFHDRSHPVHVTMRVSHKVGPLRRWAVAGCIGRAIRKASTADGAAAARRRTFRVVHFSIQKDHMHLVVEATSAHALSRGMQGLTARLARRINEKLGRRGQVFRERYHARPLPTPLEVRHALVYVLMNAAKHAEDGIPDLGTMPVDGIDPCSSARWFTGWKRPPPVDPSPCPTAAPRTWLLGRGWRRHGLVGRHERPAG
jgi:REP element-mobilizing transposase RayT